MVVSYSQYLSSSPEIPSQVLSQFLSCDNYIKIEDAVIHFEKLSTSYRSYLKMAGLYHGSISVVNTN